MLLKSGSVVSVAFLLPIVMSAVGCGQKVTLQKVQSLRINETSESQLVSMFPKAKETARFSSNGSTVVVNEYRDGGAGYIGPILWYDYYTLATESNNDRLVGYLFACNHGDDATRFDAALMSQVRDGMTREQVIAKLGQPHGIAAGTTELEGYKRASKLANVKEILAWTNAPKVQSAFKIPDINLQVHMVYLDQNGIVIGQGANTHTVRF